MSTKQKRALYIALAILAAVLLIAAVAQWRSLDNKAAAKFIQPYAFQYTQRNRTKDGSIIATTEPLTFERKDLSQPDQSLGFYTLSLMDPGTEPYHDPAEQIKAATLVLGLSSGVGLQIPAPADLNTQDLIIYQAFFNGRDGTPFMDPISFHPTGVILLIYQRGDRRQPLYAYAYLTGSYGNQILPLNANDDAFTDAFASLSGF